MLEKIFTTKNDWAGFITRVTLGIVMFPHGAQKMIGMYGGYGFNATMDFFTQTMQLPWIIAFLIIIIEFFGAISLLIGFASRFWAISFIGLFIGIIFTTHLEHGFFMNWFGNQQGEGYEYALLVIGLAAAILVNGSGKFSIDSKINEKIKK